MTAKCHTICKPETVKNVAEHQVKSGLTKRPGRAAGRWGCQALTRFGWAIQSSWTNGVRLKLARPICGIFEHFLVVELVETLASGFSCSQTESTPAHLPVSRREHAGLTQTVSLPLA